jgi:hypothetical protein
VVLWTDGKRIEIRIGFEYWWNRISTSDNLAKIMSKKSFVKLVFAIPALLIVFDTHNQNRHILKAPYPESTYISGITFDKSTLVHAAPGSDLWPNTWAEDGNIYLTWGDGGGFGGSNEEGRVSTGLAKISGPPPGMYTNVNGGYHSLYPASFDCPAHDHCGKLDDIIAYGGTLYAWLNTQNREWTGTTKPDFRLTCSTDYGKTWTNSTWTFSETGADRFFPGIFLQMGQGYVGNDGYAYVMGRRFKDSQNLYLFRVPIMEMGDKSAYRYYVGGNQDHPLWGSMADMKPVFTDQNSISQEGGILVTGLIYNDQLKRYILTEVYGTVEKVGIFEGQHPWGPWKTLIYTADWLGLSDSGPRGEALSMGFSNKWSGRDEHGGVYAWMIFSCYGCAEQYHDQFNLIKATFHLYKK